MNTAGGPTSFGVQYYEITKPGTLDVTMNLYGSNYSGNYTYGSTVKFNVNATQ